jgi:hypothetical protein
MPFLGWKKIGKGERRTHGERLIERYILRLFKGFLA